MNHSFLDLAVVVSVIDKHRVASDIQSLRKKRKCLIPATAESAPILKDAIQYSKVPDVIYRG
jgi:hypothetical protein